MARNKQKLELSWIGKDERPRLEPRILLEDKGRSYHAAARISDTDIFDNILIKGDNLLALKALEQEYTGKVKCVYIDPPYNTGSAFSHYDDGIEHSLWLSLMRDRLVILRRLLREDGTIWITLDDNEVHYCKVLCDELFERKNFLGTVIWEKSDSPRMDAEYFSSRHDFILVYAKNTAEATLSKLTDPEATPAHYDKVDENGRQYYLKPLRAMGGQGDSRLSRPNLYFGLTSPAGTEIFPQKQDGSDGAWRWSREKVESESHRIDWVKGRKDWTPYFRIYADSQPGRPPETIWTHADVGSNRTSKREIKDLFPDLIPFSTPKPERLLRRILQIATNEGEIVLDSFAGSGTTGAVAHKMNRRWIMVELGDHSYTHIVPRLRKVIDDKDQGGITKAVNWKGGGGFRFYELAPSLLKKDKWGNFIINPEYNAEMLAEAMCKNLGFIYQPSEDIYWIHGHSTETDFIYVTTQNLTREMLQVISDEVGDDRTLLICCKAFRAGRTEFPNLTLEKIPNAILKRCEWDRDNYSLQIENLPMKRPDPGTQVGLFEESE